ncbi:hypothetical protein ACLOJK_035099, partial [Asimina triloba]
ALEARLLVSSAANGFRVNGMPGRMAAVGWCGRLVAARISSSRLIRVGSFWILLVAALDRCWRLDGWSSLANDVAGELIESMQHGRCRLGG